jgi:hypothetical protein
MQNLVVPSFFGTRSIELALFSSKTILESRRFFAIDPQVRLLTLHAGYSTPDNPNFKHPSLLPGR